MVKSEAKIAALLTVSLVISLLFPLGIFRTEVFASGTTYVAANFNGYPATPSTSGPVAEAGGNWGLYNSKANIDYAVGEAVYGRTDRSLKLVSGTAGTSLYTAKFGLNIPGKVVLESYLLAADTTHTRTVDVKSTSGTWKNFLTFDPVGGLSVLGKGLGSYSANSWYHLQAVIDQTNKTADVYLNDSLQVTGASLGAVWDTINTLKVTQIGAGATPGSMYLDDVKISDYIPVANVSLNAANASITVGGSTYRLQAALSPPDASLSTVNWSSDRPDIATVDNKGIVTGISPGTANIIVLTEDGAKTGTCLITVTGMGSISLIPSAKVYQSDTIKLTAILSPAQSRAAEIIWSSDNPSVAAVDSQGVVTGIALGQATITASGYNGTKSAASVIQVVEQPLPKDAFEALLFKRKAVMDGGPELKTDDPDVAVKIAGWNNQAQALWSSMNKSPDRTSLWSNNLASSTVSDYIHTNYTRLRDLTYAYSTKGGSLYHNLALRDDILSALDWLYTNQYNENGNEFGNWYNFEIGVPAKLSDSLIMLYDELTPDQIAKFNRAIDHFTPDITSSVFDTSSYYTGSNRSDILLAKLNMAILSKDGSRISEISAEMSPLFAYVASGDGFYKDGSFVMHSKVAYTGSYGSVLLNGVSQLLYLLNGSEWAVKDPDVSNVYRWVYDSIEPIIYQGRTMDMVNGRSIARSSSNAFTNAAALMAGIVRLAQNAPPADAARFKSMVKNWVSADTEDNIYGNLPNIDLIRYVKSIMNDPAVSNAGDGPEHFEFNGMARSVHKGNGFAFGVSKSSKRIQTYELMNGENGQGWYSGDGMTYLYNADQNQYSSNFWPTVNRYRLPGTTVDTRPRLFNNYQNGDGEGTPGNAWAGGTQLGLFGSSGMQLKQIGTTLTANKSWFMFDNAIVALGSGITSTDNRTIETIVDQRKLNGTGDNAMTVDGAAKPSSLGWSETMTAVKWLHLQGNAPNSDIGYYFPDSPVLKGLREQRNGSWSEINQNITDPTKLTNNYLSLWFDHGANPNNQAYSYVILPNKSAAETSTFASHPDIQIVENSEAAHAVKDTKLNLTGIHFWKDAKTKSDIVTSSRQAAVMLQEKADNNIEVAVSDPTLENTGAIEIEIDRSAAGVLSADPGIIVTQLAPTIKFAVNVHDSLGKTFHARFDLDPSKPRPKPAAGIPSIVNTRMALPAVTLPAWIHSEFDNEGNGLEIAGNQPPGWMIANGPDTLVTLQSQTGDNNRFMRFFDPAGSGNAIASRSFPAQAGKLEVQWNFAEPNGSKSPYFELLQGNQPGIRLASEKGILNWYDSSGKAHRVQAETRTSWMNVQLKMDISQHKYDIYVDGKLRAAGCTFANPVTGLDTIRFQSGSGKNAKNGYLYVDDVMVYIYGAQPLVTENFNVAQTGGHPDGWIVTDKSSAPVSVTEDPNALNKSVLLNDNDNKFIDVLQKSFPEQSGNLVAEWDFKESNSGKTPFYELKQGGTTAIRLSTSGILKYVYASGAVESLGSVPAQTWHHVRVEADVTGQKASIYLDGVLRKEGLAFYSAVTSIDTVKFSTSYGAVDAALFLDNVNIYTNTEPKPVKGMTLSPADPVQILDMNKTLQLTANLIPADSGQQSVSWMSTNEKAAVVDGTGKVTAVKPGVTKIIATTAYGEYQSAVTVIVRGRSNKDDESDKMKEKEIKEGTEQNQDEGD